MHKPPPISPGLARYDALLRFLDSRIDYERLPSAPYGKQEFKLDRMRELLGRLGNPHQGMPCVHVAGTKGKGSAAAMIGAVLTEAGYRTGVFTSPHLDRLEERLAVNGQPCTPDDLAGLIEEVMPVVRAMDREAAGQDPPAHGPTYFEITTAITLLYFARRQVDLAVLEVGLGGRLDSTNVCQPVVSIITSISFDHTRQLGDTLESIAREKAGIIKPGVPVVSGVVAPPARQVVRSACGRHGARLYELGTDFTFRYRPPRSLERRDALGQLDFQTGDRRGRNLDRLALGLIGRHQAANAAVALAALAVLQKAGWTVPEEAVRRGLAGLAWPARIELLRRRPAVVLDAAHNGASVEALMEVLQESFSVRKRYLIFATTQEKDVRGMLRRLAGHFDQLVFTRYRGNPRWVPPEQLQAVAASVTGRRYPVTDGPEEAWAQACRWAGPEDLICVAGSFFLAAELRPRILAERSPPPAGPGCQAPPGPPN